jgi:carboxyl-terminal processing protease
VEGDLRLTRLGFGKNLSKRRLPIIKILGTTVLVLGVFATGVLVGQGKVHLTSSVGSNKQVSKNLPSDLDYTSVEKVYDSLRANFDGQLDEAKLLDGLKSGVATATQDPYTEYLNADAAKEFDEDLNGTFIGIGAELSKDPETKTIVVVAPIAGFPAEKAGLRAKDVVAEIDGKSAFDLSIAEAVKRIRGDEGSVVKLKVIRDQKDQLEFDITRQKITIPSVTSKTLDGNIGYIKIARYADDTTALVKKAAEGFQAQMVEGIVLDLRNNPGGLLDTAVTVSSLWLKNKTVLTERRDGEVIKTFGSTGPATLEGISTVVLINAGSASASEITAGALRDNDAAKLVGEKSFGKGSVQKLIRFNNESVLKVTVARWFTPAGKNIDKEGVTPDVEIKITEEDFKAGRDPQLEAAIKNL